MVTEISEHCHIGRYTFHTSGRGYAARLTLNIVFLSQLSAVNGEINYFAQRFKLCG